MIEAAPAASPAPSRPSSRSTPRNSLATEKDQAVTGSVTDALRLGCCGHRLHHLSRQRIRLRADGRTARARRGGQGRRPGRGGLELSARPDAGQGRRDRVRHLRLRRAHGGAAGRPHHQGEAAHRPPRAWRRPRRCTRRDIDGSTHGQARRARRAELLRRPPHRGVLRRRIPRTRRRSTRRSAACATAAPTARSSAATPSSGRAPRPWTCCTRSSTSTPGLHSTQPAPLGLDCRLYLRHAARAAGRLRGPPGGGAGCRRRRRGAAAAEGLPDDALRRAIDTLRPVAQSRGVAFLLNDRPDLAAEPAATAPMSARRHDRGRGPQAPGQAACSASPATTRRDLAMEAGEAGADYVAFGAFFPTATKQPPADGGGGNCSPGGPS